MRGDDKNPGVIAAAAKEIFHIVQEQAQHREYLVRLSYMEVGHHHMNSSELSSVNGSWEWTFGFLWLQQS